MSSLDDIGGLVRSEHKMTGDEYDACTGWKNFYHWPAGVRKAIKKASHRLDRRAWRRRVEREIQDS